MTFSTKITLARSHRERAAPRYSVSVSKAPRLLQQRMAVFHAGDPVCTQISIELQVERAGAWRDVGMQLHRLLHNNAFHPNTIKGRVSPANGDVTWGELLLAAVRSRCVLHSVLRNAFVNANVENTWKKFASGGRRAFSEFVSSYGDAPETTKGGAPFLAMDAVFDEDCQRCALLDTSGIVQNPPDDIPTNGHDFLQSLTYLTVDNVVRSLSTMGLPSFGDVIEALLMAEHAHAHDTK
ncbi:hypothetical protein LCGC14_1435240 [marine sediment metagenome]|uniref:Uncharacterized protein n=1 Tax=marine sediment metagenome TaxID=412755 RepID=A0A0F9JMW1_9ZZZZ